MDSENRYRFFWRVGSHAPMYALLQWGVVRDVDIRRGSPGC